MLAAKSGRRFDSYTIFLATVSCVTSSPLATSCQASFPIAMHAV
ncbi:hypothetical protein ABEI17_21400 [Pantoea agglomerans]|nr:MULTISPECIES: hypothetical protein [Pantoea]